MTTTVADIKRAIKDLPDDAKVYIEYPARYGLGRINSGEIPVETIAGGTRDEADVIPSGTVGSDGERLFVFHHL